MKIAFINISQSKLATESDVSPTNFSKTFVISLHFHITRNDRSCDLSFL